jgi:hypothetical protein
MSNARYNQIIDEVYNNYLTYIHDVVQGEHQIYGIWYGKEEFIHKCKTDPEFSEKWGLKIEERELSSAEMWEWYNKNGGPNGKTLLVGMIVYQNEEDNSHIKSWLEKWAPNVPTKQITLTYQNETIQFYE